MIHDLTASIQFAIMRKLIADDRRKLRIHDDPELDRYEVAQMEAERDLAEALKASGIDAEQLRSVL